MINIRSNSACNIPPRHISHKSSGVCKTFLDLINQERRKTKIAARKLSDNIYINTRRLHSKQLLKTAAKSSLNRIRAHTKQYTNQQSNENHNKARGLSTFVSFRKISIIDTQKLKRQLQLIKIVNFYNKNDNRKDTNKSKVQMFNMSFCDAQRQQCNNRNQYQRRSFKQWRRSDNQQRNKPIHNNTAKRILTEESSYCRPRRSSIQCGPWDHETVEDDA